MEKKEIIRQLLQNKGVVLIHRFNERLYIEPTTYIRCIGYRHVTIQQESSDLDINYSTLSDVVLDMIIKELQK